MLLFEKRQPVSQHFKSEIVRRQLHPEAAGFSNHEFSVDIQAIIQYINY